MYQVGDLDTSSPLVVPKREFKAPVAEFKEPDVVALDGKSRGITVKDWAILILGLLVALSIAIFFRMK